MPYNWSQFLFHSFVIKGNYTKENTNIIHSPFLQKDFYNCFGYDGRSTGTDIEDGKCSWLSVVALQRASPQQKELLLVCT